MIRKKSKEVNVIEHEPGTKTVAKKTSLIVWTKRAFLVFSIIWLLFVAFAPLYVKNHYEQPIKKSIVVSMFFDIQRNIQEQYQKLLDGIKKSINLEKPIAIAIDKVKIAQDAVGRVDDVSDNAKDATQKVKDTTSKLGGIAGRFGIKTDALDSANDAVARVDGAIAKVDDTTALVNKKLDGIKTELVRVSQTEVDKMIDDAIKSQLDKSSGGLGTTLLTDYGIEHVYPWRPSSWPVATKIYNDLEKSDLGVVQILTNTVNKYFGYVAWGLVIAAWLAGLIIWSMVMKKVKAIISPFIVCPRCGNVFADKRTAYGLLKVFQPWKWI